MTNYLSAPAIGVGVVFIFFAVLAAVFQFMDIVWDRQDKEKLKERIVDFWVQTSDLAFLDQVNRALEVRYSRTRKMRNKFIVLFWIFSAIVGGFVIIETLSAPIDGLRKNYSETLKISFDADYSVRCAYNRTVVDSEKGVSKACDPNDSSNESVNVKQYRVVRDSFVDYVSKMGPAALRVDLSP